MKRGDIKTAFKNFKCFSKKKDENQQKKKDENSLFCIPVANTRKVGVKLQKGRLRLEVTSEV